MRIVIAGLMMVGLAAAAHASIIAQDDFNYADGNITNVSGGLWTQYSGSVTEPVMVSGGHAVVNGTQAGDVSTALAGAPYTAGSVYFAFDLTLSALPNANGTYFAVLGQGALMRDRVFAFSGSGSTYKLGIGNDVNSSNSAAWATTLTLGEIYTVVCRSDLSTDTSYLWINPVNESSTSVSTSFASTVSASWFGLRQSAGEGTMTVDHLVVGTTFNDVVDVIPEPAATSLLGLGALAMVLCRKMKR